VYAAARRVDRMAPLARAGARPLALDVTDDASLGAAVDRLLTEAGRLDALVNNAGYGAYGALEDVPLDEGRRQFEVNLFGLARLTQLVLPTMRRQRSGRVVNVSSIGGRIHEPMGSWYHATKFAVEGLSDCLRMELAPFGIDVVVIQPGAIRTEWSGIARAGLLATSGATAYAAQARAAAALLGGADATSGADPSVVAGAVWQAVTARRPRTRYAVGGGARPLLALRRLLPDRAFDAVMRAAAAQMARRPARTTPPGTASIGWSDAEGPRAQRHVSP
jgi:NAD(P)-dependent dehydrogenase (short-subunit alcohol dehydrogenase family)